MQLEIERVALQKETDDASRRRLIDLEKELADLKEEADRLRARWQAEKSAISELSAVKEKLEAAKADLQRAKDSLD